jgi:hypothetical protein
MPMTVQQRHNAVFWTGGHGGGGNGGLNPVVPKKKKSKSLYNQLNKSR